MVLKLKPEVVLGVEGLLLLIEKTQHLCDHHLSPSLLLHLVPHQGGEHRAGPGLGIEEVTEQHLGGGVEVVLSDELREVLEVGAVAGDVICCDVRGQPQITPRGVVVIWGGSRVWDSVAVPRRAKDSVLVKEEREEVRGVEDVRHIIQ